MAHLVAESDIPKSLQRVLSAAVLIPLAVAAVLAGGIWLGAMVGVFAALMAWEWTELCRAGERAAGPGRDRAGVDVIALGAFMAAAALAASAGAFAVATALVGAGFAAAEALRRFGGAPASRLYPFGALYIGLPATALLWIAADAEFGKVTVLWAFVVVWATDTGAYCAGRLIGGPRLAPVTSPNKTWAGVAGGLVAVAVLAGLYGLGASLAHVPRFVALSVALSAVAQAGDLAESAIKRHFDVKDSGSIIPGHGGLFDRLDGALAAFPAVAGGYLLFDGGAFLWR